jgi:hypothetical protein
MANPSPSKRLIDYPLTPEQFSILNKVAGDPFEFAKFIYVINPTVGKIRFDLYPYQKAVLREFISSRFVIVKKFRQAGLTELLCLFCLWYAMYHSDKNINIISIKDLVAKKFLRKIKFMYRNLPDYLKVPIINGRSKDIGTASELEFANGSIITSIPTTEEAGRSEALSLLVIDEAAIIRWADQIWAAAFPTLSTGGRAILNSTPYGMGNFFHKTWVNACSGGNHFTPINLKWRMHPERDDSWYYTMSRALGPRRTAQEIDGDFLTSGNSVFDLLDIRAIEESLDDYVPLNIKKDPDFEDVLKGLRNLDENLLIYNKPDKFKTYSLGGDIATGRARDYSSFTILDQDGDEAASFKMKIPINEYSVLIERLGWKYNIALLAPESNDIGLGVASKLQEVEYPNLYYSTQIVKEKGQNKPKEQKVPGWYTTSKNRPIIISELEEDIRLGNITIKDPQFVMEAYTFVYDDHNKPIAKGKGSNSDKESSIEEDTYTDDTILAKAIGNHVRKVRRSGVIVLPA